MRIFLNDGWEILQDVHDNGEHCRLQESRGRNTNIGMALSDWEPLPELKHLQLLFDEHPYYGRQLRYFNQAPWWYRRIFRVPETECRRAYLHFSNVDYYCKVWLNGHLVAEHEGYMLPFDPDVTEYVLPGQENLLAVKVWSPWDDTVEKERYDARTFSVERRMVKGTYEHADTFIQRDVNPVGIYGDVWMEIPEEAKLLGPKITYALDPMNRTASVTAEGELDLLKEGNYRAVLTVTDPEDGAEMLRLEEPVGGGRFRLTGVTLPVRLWYVWDQGEQKLYHAQLSVMRNGEVCGSYGYDLGFRTIRLVRDREKTQAVLNGRPFYIRGTSYFPDVYVSNMTEERYRKDLMRIREAGFNFIRLHVHVEQHLFYEICTELGLGIMQDSEFNWRHPTDESYEKRFTEIYTETIRMLMHHTSIFFWVCLNEPGVMLPGGMHCDLMDVSPGPALYRAALETDPSRSTVKGSCWEDDPLSGDSHNYTGSLNGHDTHYSDIYGTAEKFNTEYGFDAPPCEESLAKDARLYRRLKSLVPRIGEIQTYQYKLLKYFTEHYRIQKHAPNNGYVQFLFSDLCPQSFYGIYDYYGVPKKGLLAMQESNMPVGVFLKHRDRPDEIHLVNDYPYELGECTVSWRVEDRKGGVLCEGETVADVPADCNLTVYRFEKDLPDADVCFLPVRQGETTVCANEYHELLRMPPHVEGHPERMDHELGCRLYSAD